MYVAPVLAVVALTACGGDSDTDDTSAATESEVTTTTDAVTLTTEAVTTTTEAVTTTTEAGSEFPTYAEYLAALPPGTETCETQGEVSEAGDGLVNLSGENAQISMVEGQMVVFCPGAKLVVGEPFTGVNQIGEPLEKGALFSVDPDGSYVQLSSF